MEHISALPPIQRLPSNVQAINQGYYPNALHGHCLVSEAYFYFFLLMSACHNLRSHSHFKTVFNRLADTYQAYCNAYKTHAMTTHHGGTGQPLAREDDPANNEDVVELLPDFHCKDADNF